MKKLISIVLIITYVSIASAAPTIDQLIQNIQSQISKIETYQADVNTSIISPLVNNGVPTTEKIKMYKKGNDKVRSETGGANAQIVIFNGKDVLTKDVKTGKVAKGSLESNPAQFDPFSYAKNVQSYLKEYTVQVQDTEATYRVVCIPKKKTKLIKHVDIYIKKIDYCVEKIYVYNIKDEKTIETLLSYKMINNCLIPITTVAQIKSEMGQMMIKIDYTNIKINEPLPDTLFII